MNFRMTTVTNRYRPGSALALLGFLISFAGGSAAEEDVHWGYSGEHGPEHWGELSETFEACSDGRYQSPIDIVDPIEANLGSIGLAYRGSTISLLNNGHTIEIEVGEGNSLTIDGKTFVLKQFHVHSPSEHRIEGESFPLEAHFVHQNDQGELAVVGVLFRDGPRNEGLATIGGLAPTRVGESAPIAMRIVDLKIVPKESAYYRYSGSLTTPPCTEGILWLVLKTEMTISKDQVAGFVKHIGEDARGPQPLNGRLVVH